MKKKTSAKNVGKGGAERVNKNPMTKKKERRGENNSAPRIDTS